MRKTGINGKQCDRCAWGAERPATRRVPWSFDGTEYESYLCDRHAEAIELDFDAWARLAHPVAVPMSERTPNQRVVQQIRAAQSRARSAALVTPLRRGVPESRHDWSLATDFVLPRDCPFTTTQVLDVAAQPSVRYPMSWRGKHVAAHTRGSLRVVVDEESCTVLEVLERDPVSSRLA